MESVKVSPTSRGTYVLLDDFYYKELRVPKGFETNGMDLKLRLFSLFIYRYDPRCLEAVIVHDYLCELEEYKKADMYFEEMLPNIWQKKYIMYFVKKYHYYKYNIK